MAGNSFGTVFKITTFGESHGPGIGVTVDGVPPGLELCEEDIQKELDRRKPGQSEITTPRRESDTVRILSGVFRGETTGVPVGLYLENTNTISSDYDDIKNLYRPGHADYTYEKKYGRRDWRGSGRSSGRETAGRVAGGAVARKLLRRQGIKITAFTQKIAHIEGREYQEDFIEKNPLRVADPAIVSPLLKMIERCKEEGNSLGSIIRCRVEGVPPGWGEPVFDKLEADLAKAVLSVGAVKGFEIGSGFSAALMTGKEHNDEMDQSGFLGNNAGGVLGGISTGQDILFRVAVKPPSSISLAQKTRNRQGEEVTVSTVGRHDPLLSPRIIPVIEAMTALVLADHALRHRAQTAGL